MNPELTTQLTGLSDTLGQLSKALPTVSTNDFGTQPYPLAQQQVPTKANAYIASVSTPDTQAKQTADKLAPVDNELVESRTSLRERILSGLGFQAGRADAQLQAEDQFGVADRNTELADINKQIGEADLAYRAQIEAIEKNPSVLKEARASQIQKATQDYAKTRADLAIIQNGVQGQLDAAQRNADRKVELMFEPARLELEAAQAQYELIKDELSSQEQKNFNVMMSERERTLNKQEDEAKSINSLAIQAAGNGAPAGVVQSILNAESTKEATLRASGYAVDPLDRKIKQAQLAKLYADIDGSGSSRVTPKEAQALSKEIRSTDEFKSISKLTDTLSALTNFETKFKETGSARFPGKDRAELDKLYNAAVLQAKEFFNLGVLNGPDLVVIKNTLGDPIPRNEEGEASLFGDIKTFRSTGVEAGINSLKSMIENSLDERYASIRTQFSGYGSEQVTGLQDIDRNYLLNKAQLNPEIGRLIDENPDLTVGEVISIINERI